MLSEIIPEAKGAKKDSHTVDLIEKIQRQLPDLGLSMKNTGTDYEISTCSKVLVKEKLILTPEDKKRHWRFFEDPKIPRPLDELIREYITKKTGKQWDDPVILERIRQAVIAQKGDYWREGLKKRSCMNRDIVFLHTLPTSFRYILSSLSISSECLHLPDSSKRT